jgi:hypothetical protein
MLDKYPLSPFDIKRQRAVWRRGVARIDFFPAFMIHIEEFQPSSRMAATY